MVSQICRYRKAITGFLALPLFFCLLYSQAMAAFDLGQAGQTPCSQGHGQDHGTKGTTPKGSIQHCNPALTLADQRDIKHSISFQVLTHPIDSFSAQVYPLPVLNHALSALSQHPSLQDAYLQNHALRL